MNQELVEYIKQQTSLSVSKNKITDILLGQGWQQAELDEAFAAAEGASNAAASKISQEETDPGAADDFEEETPSGGSKKKIILIGGITLVLILAIGGILAFTGGSKKQDKPVVQNPVAENNVQPAQEDNKNPAGNGATNEVDKPAIDNSSLIAAAEALSKTITPPTGWQLRQGIIHNRPLVGYFKPTVEGTGENALTENISITAENIKNAGAESEADYLAKSKSSLATSMQNYKTIVEKPVTLSDGSNATLISSSSTRDGNAIRGMQLFAFKNGVAYVITGVVMASNWDAEKDMLGAAVLSFKFPE